MTWPMRPANHLTRYFTYILRCADGTLYTGSTTDVVARERAHNEGRGAKYTAGRGPVRVVYSEAHGSRSAAQKREAQIKRWTREQKAALVAGDASHPHAPARPRR
jgi:putative endonuclease